jgi:hypothetical protein
MSLEQVLGIPHGYPKPTRPLTQRDYCAIGRKLGYVRLHETGWEVQLRRAIASHAQQRFCLGIPDAVAYASAQDLPAVRKKCLPFAKS